MGREASTKMKTFGQVIVEARKAAGLTQKAVAERLCREDGRKVLPPWLNDLEHDRRYPPENAVIEQLAELLHISADVLYFLRAACAWGHQRRFRRQRYQTALKCGSGRARRSHRGRRARHVHKGFSRNLGDPVVSVEQSRFWQIREQSLARGCCASCPRGSEAQGATAVPLFEGNEATQEGRQQVGLLRSTEEAGNQPNGPRGGRGHRNTGTFEGKMAETSDSTTVSTKLERIAKLAREIPQAALTTLGHRVRT
jgi:transcriptional regulator with XRE-family HTH domain